jgi:hypothetical protein
MINIKDYQKWLGPHFTKSIADLEFKVTANEDIGKNSGITHIAHDCIPILEFHPAPEERNGRVRYCQKFFAEVADKLEVLAMQLVPDVVIPKDWSKKVWEVTGEYLHRAYGGEEKYLPHLCTDPTVTLQDREKMVIVKLAVGIHKQYAKPQLFWMVITEALAQSADDPDMFNRVCEIEKSYYE